MLVTSLKSHYPLRVRQNSNFLGNWHHWDAEIKIDENVFFSERNWITEFYAAVWWKNENTSLIIRFQSRAFADETFYVGLFTASLNWRGLFVSIKFGCLFSLKKNLNTAKSIRSEVNRRLLWNNKPLLTTGQLHNSQFSNQPFKINNQPVTWLFN